MSDDNNLVSPAIMELISEERFYGEMILNMRIEYTDKVPTMGVNVTDTVNLFINPSWWALYANDLSSQTQFLKHECHHVLHNHFVRDEECEPASQETKPRSEMTMEEALKHMLASSRLNVSQDMAIHEYMPNMPKEFFTVDEKGELVLEPDEVIDEKTGKMVKNPKAGKPLMGRAAFVDDLRKYFESLKKQGFKKVPNIENRQMFEYYYQMLINPPKDKNGNNAPMPGGMGTIDDHGIWKEGSQDAEYVKEKVRQVVNKAVEQSGGAGSIPGECVELIEVLNYKPKNWKQDLRRFPTVCAEAHLEPSRKKRNRRYGIMYPGYRIAEAARIVAAWDSSGSMSTEQLYQIGAEMQAMVKSDVELIVIECDSQIQNVWKFEMDSTLDKIEVKGRGGTAFKPVFDYVESKEFQSEYGQIDGLIYFTDGDNFDRGEIKKPKYPVLWAMNEGCRNRTGFGWETTIPVEKKDKKSA